MVVKDILRFKGTEVCVTSPDAKLSDVVEELVSRNIGSLVVISNTSMVGIITERDILRALVSDKAPLDLRDVASVMSINLITTSPKGRLEDAMGLMTENHIRHLPVVDQGKLCGMISIGDIVKAHRDQLDMENKQMRSYIQGDVR